MFDPSFLSSLKHQCTRDLYWVLAAPYPLNPNEAYFQLFPPEIMDGLVDKHIDFMQELDNHPSEFIAYLSNKPTRRLGVYAERLLAYFFKSSPYIELVAYSEQIIRSGETIGEIDFIVEWEGVCYHIEFAVKYYLGTGELNEYANWIGPSGNDSLDLKLDKVLNKQLPLAEEPEIQAIIGERDCTSYMFLKGKFFLPADTMQVPNWVNPNAPLGEYARISASSDLLKRCAFHHLTRPNWLSDITSPLKENLRIIKKEDLKQQIIQLGGLHMVQSQRLNQSHFLVLDEWPTIKSPLNG